MENVNILTNLIGSVGFPAVMCLLLYKRMNEESKRNHEEIMGLKDAIHSLEMAISTLCEKMNKGG